MRERLNYLVWSNDHGGWWGPDRAGYTTSLERAGRYTADEARSIVNGASVDGHLTHFDGQVLPDVMVVAPEHRTAGCDTSEGDGRPNPLDELARLVAMCERLEQLTGIPVMDKALDTSNITGVRNEPGIQIACSFYTPAAGDADQYNELGDAMGDRNNGSV